MDYRDNDYDRMDSRYSGNRNLYCDLCFRRCRGVYHVIEKGDTLYSLGKRYHVSVSDLMRANPYVNVYNLRIGEELCIPVRPQPRMENMNEENWNSYPSESQTGTAMPDDNNRMMQGNTMMPDNNSRMMPEDTAMPGSRGWQMDAGGQESRGLQWNTGMSDSGNMRENNEMSDMRDRQDMEEKFVEEEEVKAEGGSAARNQFSENDSLKDVLGRMGLSMSDFMECLSKKMD